MEGPITAELLIKELILGQEAADAARMVDEEERAECAQIDAANAHDKAMHAPSKKARIFSRALFEP